MVKNLLKEIVSDVSLDVLRDWANWVVLIISELPNSIVFTVYSKESKSIIAIKVTFGVISSENIFAQIRNFF
jgi:hypothetical protein